MAKDKAPSHPSVSTPVDTKLHKEDLQAVGDPTSLRVASEEGAHPLLSSGTNPSVLVDKTKSARDGSKTTYTVLGTNKESGFEKMSKKIKMEDISHLMQDARSAFFTHDSPPNEPIIVLDESKEEQTERHKEPEDTSDKLEQQKAKAKAEVATLKAKPLYPDIKQLTELLELKRHVQRMEIKLPGDLNDIPTKLETFTSTVSSIMSQLRTLDTLPSLLNKVANTLNKFASIMENASHIGTRKGVPSAGLATASPAEGEKRTNPTTKDADITNMHNELVYLLGIDVVTQYYNKKLLYDKYYDKMLKRRKSSKIINVMFSHKRALSH
ncbi:hypothetical protein Tco_0281032 [Tanacetum coccineum]